MVIVHFFEQLREKNKDRHWQKRRISRKTFFSETGLFLLQTGRFSAIIEQKSKHLYVPRGAKIKQIFEGTLP
ncbi:MAG: hypothetical protein K6F56_09310 [Oscillospiraceae bacterium]|nr:hypothetical protein [Oscillospiraceae bacterium]